MGSHPFEVKVLLLVLPTTEYQKRAPLAIGTTISEMAVDYIGHNSPKNLSQSWKAVCCATQSRWLVQAQPIHKYFIKTTMPVTLTPFTTTLNGSSKLRSHGMRLNLIAEPSESTQLSPSVQCAPTYCILEPGSNRVAVGLRNVLAKSITIPLRAVVGQLQHTRMIPYNQTSKLQDKQGPTRGEGIPGFRPTKFRGVRQLDTRTTAISQKLFSWICRCLLSKWFGFRQM